MTAAIARATALVLIVSAAIALAPSVAGAQSIAVVEVSADGGKAGHASKVRQRLERRGAVVLRVPAILQALEGPLPEGVTSINAQKRARQALASAKEALRSFNDGKARAQLADAVKLMLTEEIDSTAAALLADIHVTAGLAAELAGDNKRAGAEFAAAYALTRNRKLLTAAEHKPSVVSLWNSVVKRSQRDRHRLSVASQPKTAELFIDGRRVFDRDKLELGEGIHYITVRAEGHRSMSQALDVQGRSKRTIALTVLPVVEKVQKYRAGPARDSRRQKAAGALARELAVETLVLVDRRNNKTYLQLIGKDGSSRGQFTAVNEALMARLNPTGAGAASTRAAAAPSGGPDSGVDLSPDAIGVSAGPASTPWYKTTGGKTALVIGASAIVITATWLLLRGGGDTTYNVDGICFETNCSN